MQKEILPIMRIFRKLFLRMAGEWTGTGCGSWPPAGFGYSGVETSDSATAVNLTWYH